MLGTSKSTASDVSSCSEVLNDTSTTDGDMETSLDNGSTVRQLNCQLETTTDKVSNEAGKTVHCSEWQWGTKRSRRHRKSVSSENSEDGRQ